MPNASDLLARLGLRHPIFQAPMAGVSTPRLAAAVSNAGGLGALGIGASTAAQARAMIEETFALTDRPFNVNVFCHAPAPDDPAGDAAWLAHLAPRFQALGLTPPAAAGDLPQLRAGRRCVRAAAGTAPRRGQLPFRAAGAGVDRRAAAGRHRHAGHRHLPGGGPADRGRGVDAIVAQGIEAGGHRGMFDPSAPDERLSTLVLLQRLRRETRLPLIAAGGLMDGAGIRAALALGAVAAQLGTAFVLCPESAADAAYRAALQGERAEHTRLTSCCPAARPAGC
jgi:nitronate monooxygenase